MVDVPDIKKFTAKSSAPDLTKYILKSKIPSCPDMRKYILKNQIPKCKAMPDITKYILKSKGILALEIGNDQYFKVSQILKSNFFRTKYLIKDFKNNIRCILSELNF